jgi:ABC-type uncharacterized transport system auxiliary subunit
MNHAGHRRSSVVVPLALLLALGGCAPERARAEDAATPPPAAADAKPAAPKPADTAKPATPGARPATPPATQQRFTPSERVRADFPVSFPVDI